jgi:hypothetical protein
LPNLGAGIPGQRRNDRRLAGTRLSQKPYDERVRLSLFAGILAAGGTLSASVSEQGIADGLPQPVEKFHGFPQMERSTRGFDHMQTKRSHKLSSMWGAETSRESSNFIDWRVWSGTNSG